MSATLFGTAQDRVDGPAKVTGAATYAGEFGASDLAHGYVVSSGIARGRIASIDDKAARAAAGVIRVFTHENRPGTAWFDHSYRDDVAPPGSPFRPLSGNGIVYSGQPIALVVAESFEAARHAASLLRVEYVTEPHQTDLHAARADAYDPPEKRSGISPPPKPRGGSKKAMATAPVKVEQEYFHDREYHNPMEPHATTVVWQGDGKILVHDKIQGVQATQKYVSSVFGLSKSDVRVVSPFIGGAFGCGLRPQYQLFLAVMAALDLKRSVRVVLTRDQMFTFTYRPETIQTVALGANAEGQLQAISHDVVAATSHFEDYQESVVNWTGLLYKSDNVTLTYKLAKLDSYTPGDMRAPGAPTGTFAIESAIDELAYATGIDPVELRLHNYTDRDADEDKPFTSKSLREAFYQGAAKFGWSRRTPAPRSMRDGTELIGWGMATGAWEAMMQKHSASATVDQEGKLTVACATADIGTGTYTILTQIGADALGLGMQDVTTLLADSDLPAAPVEGGSWVAASAGSAVQAACYTLRGKLLRAARSADNSPLANADLEHVVFAGGRIAIAGDPSRFVTLADAVRASGKDQLSAEESAQRDKAVQKNYTAYTHSAVFVEVRVDEELGTMRVTRVVDAVAAGKIINPKTARSQVLGGVVMGIGMTLHEEGMMDNRLGRIMNHNFAEYHIPVNADIEDIEVIFVEEHDDKVSPIGVKGLGEIGIVGISAAIANAVYHATGKRIRDLPITIDKVLDA